MGRKINRAVVEALKNVEVCKARIHALHYAVAGLREGMARWERGADEDFSRLHSMLYRNLNDAYATVFLWGAVDKEAQRHARKFAFEHYLREGVTIMQYLQPSQQHPSMWSDEEEKEFRAEIAAAKKGGEK